MIKEAIKKATNRENLTQTEMEAAMEDIMEGNATGAQIGCLLTALKMKGETVPEITGAATVMRRKALKLPDQKLAGSLLDTCGTGGDCAGTFNISTTVAFIVAGAGAQVAKHGNRSVSSSCGSADVLRELGASLDLTPDRISSCIENTGFGFLFAPSFHLAMKHAAGPRQEMGIRTLFNLLGPLTNPAGAGCQLLGVYDPDLTESVALALDGLGIRSALVVHGMDGLDEISVSAVTKITRLHNSDITTAYLDPLDYGIPRYERSEILGGTAKENALHLREVLDGKRGARRDIALLNAAGALIAAEMAEDFREGLELAASSVDSGRAANKLDEYLIFTRPAA